MTRDSLRVPRNHALKNELLVILVTGGTRGIGAAVAAQLHGRGHRVYVTQRAKLEGGRHDGLQVLCLDVTSAASVEACVHELLRREGRVDVLVNNAGYDLFGAVLETQWHEFMDQLDTNFLGAARMVQAVLPRMLERRSGRIINISSIGGEVGLPMNAAYSASKFALEGYTESLRQELLPLGLYACTVSPSPVATGPLDQSIRKSTQPITRSPSGEPNWSDACAATASPATLGRSMWPPPSCRRCMPECRRRATASARSRAGSRD